MRWQTIAALVVALGLFAAWRGGPDVPHDPGKAPPLGEAVSNAGWPVGQLAPRGKGIFLQQLSHASGPKNLADRLEYLGMKWVMIQTVRSTFGGGPALSIQLGKMEEHIAALRERGIGVALWGWAEADGWESFADKAAEHVERFDAAGFVVNAERPWKGKGRGKEQEAVDMMYRIRNGMGQGRSLGFTSYGGGPKYHPNFPWQAFATYADMSIPQIYDTKQSLPPSYPPFAVNEWAQMFPRIVPAWGAGDNQTPDTMRLLAQETPIPRDAVCWWELKGLITNTARVNFVRGFSLRQAVA